MIKEKAGLIQFDWSGTISDDTRPVYSVNRSLRAHFGLDEGPSIEEWLRKTDSNAYDSVRALGIEVTKEKVDILFQKFYNKALMEGIRPFIYDEVPEVLEHLKQQGKKLTVVSSHPTVSVMEEAREYGILEYFDNIQGGVLDKSADIGGFAALHKMEPGKTIYIGDMIHDVRAARTAGVIPIALSRGYHNSERLRAEKPHLLWDSLHPAKGEF